MKKYRGEYAREQWQRRTYRWRAIHLSLVEFQIIERDLENGHHLFVELAREPDASLRLCIARLDIARNTVGRIRYHRQYVCPDEIELIEVADPCNS